MSRFLHRPMFRRGGSTGEGITSGLRQGYAFGSTGAQRDYLEATKKNTTSGGSDFNLNEYLSEVPELPKSQSRSDFLINFGLDLATRSPQGNIVQTAAASMREPFKQFQQQAGQEDLLKYKHAQGERQFQLEWYKALSKEDKLKVQEQLEWYIEKGMTPAEALDAIMHRKPVHPKEKAYQEEKAAKADLDLRINRLIEDNDDIQFRDQAEVLLEYRDNRQKWADKKLEQDTSQIYIDIDDMNQNLQGNQEGTEWTPSQGANLEGDYIINKIYVDLNSGNVYLWDGISFKQQDLNATNIEQ